VSWPQREVRLYGCPKDAHANLNTCASTATADLCTPARAAIGVSPVRSGQVTAGIARGRGLYGICSTPGGDVWWCLLAGSSIARIDRKRASLIVEPPTMARRAPRLADSAGRIWGFE
jgi:virginiamycin B lyase